MTSLNPLHAPDYSVTHHHTNEIAKKVNLSTRYFKSNRGLRQGDPISPALFILAAEWLSRGLNVLFKENPTLWYFPRSTKIISHLAYADDLIIFTKYKHRETQKLMKFLQHYETVSRQSVSKEKSIFVVRKRCPRSTIAAIHELTRFTHQCLPITYLGAPLYVGNRKLELFLALEDKIRNQIIGWEHNVLSHGGRLQLIKSTLSSMTSYLFQVIPSPMNLITQLERLFNRFFLGSYGSQCKIHWAHWDFVCYPYEEGGFNIRQIRDVVNSYACKLWWNFRQQASLWARFMKFKCFGYKSIFELANRQIQSPTWRRMTKWKEVTDNNIFWAVGKGAKRQL